VTENIPSKTPTIISVILTILLLVIFGILSALFEMFALNSVSERQGGHSHGHLACLSGCRHNFDRDICMVVNQSSDLKIQLE